MTKEETLVPTLGQWVDDKRFWNGEHEISRFIELLDEGASISLMAPRRVGKTSLMHEVARRVRARFTCFQLDLESSRTPDEVLAELVQASDPNPNAGRRIKRALKDTLGFTKEVKVAAIEFKLREELPGRWEERGNKLVGELATLDPPPVLFIDEVPVFVHRLMCEGGHDRQPTMMGLQHAKRFLDWLRYIVQTHRSRLRIVITGSIGMGPLLERYSLTSQIDCFTPLEMLPWDRQTAIRCLQALARYRKIWFESGADARVVELLGVATPYHLQLFFERLDDCVRRRNEARPVIFPEDVDTVYRTQMLGPKCRNALVHYDARLKHIFSPKGEQFARTVLTQIAVEESISLATALRLAPEHCPEFGTADRNLVIQVLEHDGYLSSIEANSRSCRFASNYLRDWWCQRYVPVA